MFDTIIFHAQTRERMNKGNDEMPKMPEHEALKILGAAIDQHVKNVAGPTAIATGYVVLISTADLNHPGEVTAYLEGYKGPMHALFGLNDMQREMIRSMNDEEANNGL